MHKVINSLVHSFWGKPVVNKKVMRITNFCYLVKLSAFCTVSQVILMTNPK